MNVDAESVTVVITCAIRPDKVAMARRELHAVIRTVMANEPACRGIRVHDDPKDPRRLLIIEHWESEQAFTGPHMQTPHMQMFLRTAKEFLDGEAKFCFWREIIKAP
jgi:quinol monooxygenase YgiN